MSLKKKIADVYKKAMEELNRTANDIVDTPVDPYFVAGNGTKLNREILAGKKCYLSGPIEASGYTSSDQEFDNWRTEPTQVLEDWFDMSVFDPFEDTKQNRWEEINQAKRDKDYESLTKIARGFVLKDLSEVDHSDLIIAYVPKGVPTTGTTHEVINANDRKKPVLLVCPEGKENVPLWYYGFIDADCMFGSWHELYDFLDDINNMKLTDNTRFWRIYGLI